MKKVALLLVCLITLVCQAQTGHLKFAGIPINASISQFQTKLTAKGYKLDKQLNAQIPVGCRAFNGIFVGNKVIVYVYYDERTRTVYRVKAVLSGISEDIADQQYQRLKDLFIQKYEDYYSFDGEKENKEAFSLLPKRKFYANEDESRWQNSYGSIDLFITKDEDIYLRYPYHFNLHIDYTDQINSDKHENSMLDDL